jgi:MFS family permease
MTDMSRLGPPAGPSATTSEAPPTSGATVATVTGDRRDTHPARWRMLALLAVAELLGMSLWFAASAISTSLAGRWEISTSTGAAWLMTAVQIGFVSGTAVAAVLNLADLVPAARYFAGSALLGAAANAALLVAPDFQLALVTRFLTGFFLAGVYPPAMKMVATWFKARRGLAIGTVVGALTVGKATPYLVLATLGATAAGAASGSATQNADSAARVVLAASLGTLVAAALVLIAYRDGPYPFQSRPISWRLVADVWRERRWRLATSGYLGHMWELYAFWTWIPAFIAASLAARAGAPVGSPRQAVDPAHVAALAFATIAVGGLGCIWGGVAADRAGRERLVVLAMSASGVCSLFMPALFGRASWLLAVVLCVWSFFVIADSAQFSALVTESVPAHAVGTALTLQTSLGFLLTTFSIQLVPPLAELFGWRWAFPILALGPGLGIVAIRRLVTLKRTPAPVAARER